MLKVQTLALGAAAVAALWLSACKSDGGPAGDTAAALSDGAVDIAALAEAAVANPARPEQDRADDAKRKPAQVLAFTAVEPGMTVFEMEAGRGYYTELLSYIVGPDGEVIMQNTPVFDSFLGEALAARMANDRLPNVRVSKTAFDELDAPDGSVDIATWFLGPHELYFKPTGVDSLGDVEKTYAELYRVLKPGGVLVILDHAAAPGSPETSGDTHHRIDPEIVKRLVGDAGFEFVSQSDILRNPNDDYEKGVFDPAVRRQTDRFLLKYKKPERETDDAQ